MARAAIVVAVLAWSVLVAAAAPGAPRCSRETCRTQAKHARTPFCGALSGTTCNDDGTGDLTSTSYVQVTADTTYTGS